MKPAKGSLSMTGPLSGIQFVTDEKGGRKVAVQIDLPKHRAL